LMSYLLKFFSLLV